MRRLRQRADHPQKLVRAGEGTSRCPSAVLLYGRAITVDHVSARDPDDAGLSQYGKDIVGVAVQPGGKRERRQLLPYRVLVEPGKPPGNRGHRSKVQRIAENQAAL